MELYLSQHGGKADSNARYILGGGGNDILDTTNHSPGKAWITHRGTRRNRPKPVEVFCFLVHSPGKEFFKISSRFRKDF